MVEQVKEYREKLIEGLAEVDEHLMEKYLDGEADHAPRSCKAAVRKGTHRHDSSFPVLCGASFKNKGVQPLLDAVVDYLPSPLDIPPGGGHQSRDAARSRSARPPTTRRSRRWRSRS